MNRFNNICALICLLQIFCSVDIWAQTPGQVNREEQVYNGNFRIHNTAGQYYSAPFCRLPTGSTTINYDNTDFTISQSQFESAVQGSGTVFLNGTPYRLLHFGYELRHKQIDDFSGCSDINSSIRTRFFKVSESDKWYYAHLKPRDSSGFETFWDIANIRYDLKIGNDANWTNISNESTSNTYATDNGVNVFTNVHRIGAICSAISGFNMLRFQPKYIPEVSPNGYTNYQVRMILSYKNCSGVFDTMVYNFAIFERIKNIDYTFTQPCASGATSNGSVTLDFDNRTGGKYFFGGLNSEEYTKRNHFSITLYKDRTLNGVYDDCESPQEYPFSSGSNTRQGLPAGDYLLEVKCTHDDFSYAYAYYDTITIYPRVEEIGFEDKYFICDRNTGVTLSLPANSYQKKWTSSCYSIAQDTLLTQTFTRGANIIATATVSGCHVRDTVRIVDLTGFERQLHMLDSVISISASEYSSNWPPSYLQMSWKNKADLDAFRDLPAYQKGSAGVYRPAHAYDYLDTRIQSRQSGVPQVSLKGDGVINDVKFFDWMYGADTSCLPGWILNATMTKYNASGFDIENKDIMNIYSSALYGYRNQLPVAVSANAKSEEIGFESFEEYLDTTNLNQLNNSSGNIDLVHKFVIAGSERVQKYSIPVGQGNFALVSLDSPMDVGLCDDGWTDVDLYIMIPDPVTGKISDFTISTKTKIIGGYCNSGFAIVEFPENIPGVFNPNECRHWRGELMLKQQVSMGAASYTNIRYLKIIDGIAHTGKKSLRIPARSELPVGGPVLPGRARPFPRISVRQFKLALDQGKKYQISAWIRHTDMDRYSSSALETYNRENEVGIHIRTGQNEFFFQPSGKVINGWQKISASFIHMSGDPFIDLTFTNLVPMYLDDIRIFPEDGNLQTYVYDPVDYRLRTVLDANNYATIYIYDAEGRVFAVKKETEDGILTLQQSNNYIKKHE